MSRNFSCHACVLNLLSKKKSSTVRPRVLSILQLKYAQDLSGQSCCLSFVWIKRKVHTLTQFQFRSSLFRYVRYVRNIYTSWVLENKFWITCRKHWRNVGNLEKISEKFWTDFVEVFCTFLWNLEKISKNCWKNYGINKCWINFGKIMRKYRSNFILLILWKL